MRAEEIQTWLAESGFPEATGLAPLQPGLGSTGLWSFSPAPGTARLVIRVFGEGGDQLAEREFLAMSAAASAGVPVPGTVARGTIAGRPLLVTTFVPGSQASDAVRADPARAYALGVAMGEALGRMHTVVAPAALTTTDRSWLDLGGPALDPIRPLLATAPMPDRLLHLDYHLLNVLIENGRVTGVVDWENTRAGPPHMDLARTRAILRAWVVLRAIVLGDPLSPTERNVLIDVERGLAAGHAAFVGPDPDPALSTAWGLAMTVADLERQLTNPGSPIDPALVERLAAERDAAIGSVSVSDD